MEIDHIEKQELPTNIPNEQNLPKLHVISFRRNHTLSINSSVNISEISVENFKNSKKEMEEIRGRLLAVIKLILGDSIATEFFLCSLISRVYQR